MADETGGGAQAPLPLTAAAWRELARVYEQRIDGVWQCPQRDEYAAVRRALLVAAIIITVYDSGKGTDHDREVFRKLAEVLK